MVRRNYAFILLSIIFNILLIFKASAISGGILITQVEAGGPTAAANAPLIEYVSIYNNSSSDIEITDWCLINKSLNDIVCFNPVTSNIHYWLKSHSYLTIGSAKFNDYYGVVSDLTYTPTNNVSGSITASSDSISIKDKTGTIVDTLNWSSTLSGGHILQRTINPVSMEYTDSDTSSDFTNTTSLTIKDSGIYEEVLLVDYCNNIEGIQTNIPAGYLYDDNSDCQADACLNLSGLQLTVPLNMYLSSDNVCLDIDLCSNLPESQIAIPENYYADEYGRCYILASKLVINELYPNPSGTDYDNEFIEIYNPNYQIIDLSFYKLGIGIDSPKYYVFPIGSIIQPKSYFVIYNKELNFTLLNSTSQVSLSTIDNQLIYTTDIYLNPKDGESWNFISGTWEYSNQPSPGNENLENLIIDNSSEEQIKCAANQYFNSETNRCRLITTKSSKLTPCKDGEYRSEETNRCRAILGASMASSDCPEGQSRNPETNRCRKNIEISKTDYPSNSSLSVDDIEDGKLVLVGVLISTAGYGLWEWRFEINDLVRKFKKLYKKYK